MNNRINMKLLRDSLKSRGIRIYLHYNDKRSYGSRHKIYVSDENKIKEALIIVKRFFPNARIWLSLSGYSLKWKKTIVWEEKR